MAGGGRAYRNKVWEFGLDSLVNKSFLVIVECIGGAHDVEEVVLRL